MKSTWTQVEDNKLLELVEREGTSWAKISKKFNSRTPHACRARHNLLLENSQLAEADHLEHHLRKSFCAILGEEYDEDASTSLFLLEKEVQQRIAQP
jgi:hypothetical protein